MKILFLDIDGPLCTELEQMLPPLIDGERPFNSEMVNELNKFIKEHSYYIVIISSWRNGDLDWIKKIFTLRGFLYSDRIIGETPSLKHLFNNQLRGLEIKTWLQNFEHKNVEYLILDDVDDFLEEQKKFWMKRV